MDGPRLEVKALKDHKGAFVALQIDGTVAQMVPDAARILCGMLEKVADAVDQENERLAKEKLEQERVREKKRASVAKGQATKKKNEALLDAWLKARTAGEELPDLPENLVGRANRMWLNLHPGSTCFTAGASCYHCGSIWFYERVEVNGRSWLLCPGCIQEMKNLEEKNGCAFGECRPDGPKKGQRLWWSTHYPGVQGGHRVAPKQSLEQREDWVRMDYWTPAASGFSFSKEEEP